MSAPSCLHLLRRRTNLVTLLLVGLAAGTGQAAGPSMADAPIIDFRLAMFDAVNGHKTSDLRGGTAIYHSAELLEVRDFTLTLLRRDGARSVQARSPKAFVHLKTRRIEGEDAIEVSGPNYAITGQRWTYDERAKAVTVRDQARVVFNVALLDVLK
ncbi:MAG: LPS export ABC transporter periplasmic protein LptC [Opitutaceae bacterium]|nr:LPS export ABC transporter periplasmic protein LptC [Opitutaceae bacterium]